MGAYDTKLLGSDTIRIGIFIATEKRVVFFAKRMFAGFDLESFPYSNISSLEAGKDLLGQKLTFHSSGNSVNMKWINRGDVEEFIKHVRGSIGKTEATRLPARSAIDPIEQIKRLSELKEAGLLTEGEFSAKKQELLARM